MRLRKLLTFSALALALSVSLTGCGNKDEPLTDAQMQRKMQEQQLAAQQQRMDLERAQVRADLASQQARDQALLQQQQLQQQQYQQAPQQYNSAPAQAPAQHADSGIGAGTAILGAAAVGTAGYLMGRSNSNNNTTYNNSRPLQQPATRVITQPSTRVYQAPAQQAYKAPPPASKPAAGFTRMSSTKRR